MNGTPTTDQALIGYSQFVTICHVDDPNNFGGFRVEPDGVYVVLPPPSLILTPDERAAVTWHPTGNLDKPALPFPCTLEKVRHFADSAGLSGCIDENEVAGLPPADLPDVATGPKVKKKAGRKPGKQRDRLQAVLDALESWASKNGKAFDCKNMPGQVGAGPDDEGSFHWFCMRLSPSDFRKSARTFENYRAGLCVFPPYAKPSSFYREALPHIAQSLHVVAPNFALPEKTQNPHGA